MLALWFWVREYLVWLVSLSFFFFAGMILGVLMVFKGWITVSKHEPPPIKIVTP